MCCVYRCICKCIGLGIGVSVSVCMYVCVYMCVDTYELRCMYRCVSICMYTYVSTYVPDDKSEVVRQILVRYHYSLGFASTAASVPA